MIARLAFAALILHLVLIQPNHPGALALGALRQIPLELPVVLLGLVVLRGPVWRAALVAVLVVGAVLKGGDIAMFTAFNRPFNLMLDMPLVASGWQLASGAIGVVLAGLVVLAVVVALCGLTWLLWWAAAQWARLALPPVGRWVAAVGAVLAAGVVLSDLRGAPFDQPGNALTLRILQDRVRVTRQTLADLARFRVAAASDPYARATGLMDRIGAYDVVIVFIESYGRTSFDTPLYAATHLPTLRAAESDLAAKGLALRSGWLTSPISGGQSWLAHGTLASGLALANQTRYGAMLASPRRTLFHLAQDAGFRTVAVMPAITLAWPEGKKLGFQTIHAAADLGYRGMPFNWVTMPDQFTLAAVDRLVFSDPDPRPVFAEVVLISSHAPWVPVPRMIPWDELGDGSVFNAMAVAGDPPNVVWRDPDRVRDQYRQAIDYSLQAVMGYAARHAAAPPLMIVLGDHQPAPFVALSDNRDVPVHLIGPPELVALADGWGWTRGLIPGSDTPVWPMEDFRDRFLAATTGSAAP